MIFHLIVNSIIVFTMLALAIELIIYIFNIQAARIRYCFRLLPLLKFPFDLVIFLILGRGFFHNYNPFSCEYEMMMYLKGLFVDEMVLTDEQPLLIPQYITSFLPDLVVDLFLLVAIISSTVIFAYKCGGLIRSKLFLDQILKNSKPVTRGIENTKLSESLNVFNAKILTSNEITVPFAAGKKSIFIPSALVKTLSQEEFEAVIAHELEHLRWRDPLLRIFSNILCATFWWIPSTWFIRKLEEDQEEASDDTIYKYDIEPYALGSALVKTIKGAKASKFRLRNVCPLASVPGPLEKRLNNLLNPKRSQNVVLAALAGMLSAVTFISFWAC